MTEQEIRRLLAILMAYDNRKPGDGAVFAWMLQAQRNDWTYAEAEEAIHAHHSTAENPYMTPGHVSDRIRAARFERARQQRRAVADAEMAALEPPPDASRNPARVDAIIGELAKSKGWIRAKDRPDAAELSVRCPHCGAPPGRRCARQVHTGRTRGQFRPIHEFHDSRSQLVKGHANSN